MFNRIGFLLPRSTDYPAMGYDILDGMRANLNAQGCTEVKFITENIGFGENLPANYAKAEKLLLEEGVDMIVAYCNAVNAEPLYQLADALKKPFIILDAGMQLPDIISDYCYHISLQGTQACRLAGQMAGSGKRKVLMATSFYDGGYRGPWGYDRGLSEAGGSICANYVSTFRITDFTIEPYIGLLTQSGAASVGACFSSYLAELFFKALKERKDEGTILPIYCSPFMAEEQLLNKCDFPGGEFYTVVPWASSLVNNEQEKFSTALNKQANLFHLLGWEAGIVAQQLSAEGVNSLPGFEYQSPRGKVIIHPVSRHTYAPLYKGRILEDEEGKCKLLIMEEKNIDADEHLKNMEDKPDQTVSGWKNNYLCI
jgi:branched-chain amino acid transport system substrate-binding protein